MREDVELLKKKAAEMNMQRIKIVKDEELIDPKLIERWKKLLEQYVQYRTWTEDDLKRPDYMIEALRMSKKIDIENLTPEQRTEALKQIVEYAKSIKDFDDIQVVMLDYTQAGDEYTILSYEEEYGIKPQEITLNVIKERHEAYLSAVTGGNTISPADALKNALDGTTYDDLPKKDTHSDPAKEGEELGDE